MPKRPATALAVACLITAAFARAREQPSTNKIEASSAGVLQWLEARGFPSLNGYPYIHLTFTETNPPSGEAAIVVKSEGFLLKETDKELTVFALELEENLHDSYTGVDPPFWPLTVNTIKKDLATERVEYQIVGYDLEAAALLKEMQLPNDDETNERLWEACTFRHLPKPAAVAVFASACHQNKRAKIAEQLIEGISRTYERYLSEGEKEKPFPKFLEDALSETLVWHATLQFDDPTVSRSQLLATFRDLSQRFPRSRHQPLMKETIANLESMVREDRAHRPRPFSQLTKSEQIRELVFQLRDQNGLQQMQPGECDIFARDDPKSPTSPASQLVKTGYDAVPQLIDALEDQRFTRSIHFWRGYCFSHYILRVGDCAQIILEKIAKRRFYEPKTTSSDMTSDHDVASTKKAVQKWWSDFQQKTPPDSKP